jgi:hypothetical protein
LSVDAESKERASIPKLSEEDRSSSISDGVDGKAVEVLGLKNK